MEGFACSPPSAAWICVSGRFGHDLVCPTTSRKKPTHRNHPPHANEAKSLTGDVNLLTLVTWDVWFFATHLTFWWFYDVL